VVRQARGFGQIVFLAADPELPPLRQWPDRKLLLARLLDNPPPATLEAEQSRAILHQGYTDLAGQLRSALDQFASVTVVPLWLVLALLGGYLLMIGPGDYLLVHKLLRRAEWTWFTFPLVTVLFAAGAYVLARWATGTEVHVNQVDLVDVDATTGKIRGTAWANLFSPRTDRYNLAFQPLQPSGEPATGAATLTSWLGLPGSALGGMDPSTVDPLVWNQHYDFSERLDAVFGLPIQVRSTRSLTGRWIGRTANLPQADLVDEDQMLLGTVTNTLDFPLADCVLAYRRWAYELGTLEPGQSAEIGPMARRRDLETFLTGRKLTSTEASSQKFRLDTAPLYDQSSLDPVYILRTMVLFDAAGGRRYTGLFNQYQGFVDLTGLLNTNRAVLMGRVPEELSVRRFGAVLLRDGRPLAAPGDRHLTVYRFVFAVKTQKSG